MPSLLTDARVCRYGEEESTASVEELNRRADEYFRRYTDLAASLSKPFTNAEESSDLMIAFSQVLNG